MFIYSERQVEDEPDANDELVLIGLTVDDDEGVIPTSSFPKSVNFPQPRTTLSGGHTYVVLMPDSGLDRLENDDRLTVHYAPDRIAECLLGPNFLPPAVFGRDSDHDVRARVFDILDLTDRGIQEDGTEYRNQLRELAGMDSVDAEEVESQSRAEELKADLKYSELQDRAKDLGIEDARQSKDDLATYIVDHEER